MNCLASVSESESRKADIFSVFDESFDCAIGISSMEFPEGVEANLKGDR